MTAPQPSNDEILVRWSDLLAQIAALKNDLLGGAGGAYDTLGELAALLVENSDTATALAQQIAERAPLSHRHAIADIITSNTPTNATFLRGDGQWIAPTNTTYAVMTESEATTGTATTARTITASALKGAVQRWATGSAATAVSVIGQALNRASDAAAARLAIGAEQGGWQGTTAQYNALATKDENRNYYLTD